MLEGDGKTAVCTTRNFNPPLASPSALQRSNSRSFPTGVTSGVSPISVRNMVKLG